MLVFNNEQLNFYDFWINSKYDFSKYLPHQNTGHVLISIAFLASHSSMKEAFIKQKLNAGAFLHNQWRARLATLTKWSMLLGGWTRLTMYSRHTTLYLCTSWLFCLFSVSCCRPSTERRARCIASVGHRKKKHHPALYWGFCTSILVVNFKLNLKKCKLTMHNLT